MRTIKLTAVTFALFMLAVLNVSANVFTQVGVYKRDPATSGLTKNYNGDVDGMLPAPRRNLVVDYYFTYNSGSGDISVSVEKENGTSVNIAEVVVTPNQFSMDAYFSNSYRQKVTITLTFMYSGYFSQKIRIANQYDNSDYSTFEMNGTTQFGVGLGDHIELTGPTISAPLASNEFNAVFHHTPQTGQAAVYAKSWSWNAGLLYEGGGVYSLNGVQQDTQGDPEYPNGVAGADIKDYSKYTINAPGNALPDYEWVRDASGNITGSIQATSTDNNNYQNASGLVLSVPHQPNPIHVTKTRTCGTGQYTISLKYKAGGASTYKVYVEGSYDQPISAPNPGGNTASPTLPDASGVTRNARVKKYITTDAFAAGSATTTTFSTDALVPSGQTVVGTSTQYGWTTTDITFTGTTHDVTIGVEGTDANNLGTRTWTGSAGNCCATCTVVNPDDLTLSIDVAPNPTGGVIHLNYDRFVTAVANATGNGSFAASLYIDNSFGGNVLSQVNVPVRDLPQQVDLSNQNPSLYKIRVVAGTYSASATVIKY